MAQLRAFIFNTKAYTREIVNFYNTMDINIRSVPFIFNLMLCYEDSLINHAIDGNNDDDCRCEVN